MLCFNLLIIILNSFSVCHLAGEFAKSLQYYQQFDKYLKNEHKIIEQDVLCIQIAGLCHDLGHGPFSHVFDGQFIPQFRKCWKVSCYTSKVYELTSSFLQHEKASIEMLEHLICDNNLFPKFQKYGLEDRDIKFIKELILGVDIEVERCSFLYHDDLISLSVRWTCTGRDRDKSFLYEVSCTLINSYCIVFKINFEH